MDNLVEAVDNLVAACVSDPSRSVCDVIDFRALAEHTSAGRWVPYFTVHGDPFVLAPPGQYPQDTIATVSVAPEDYGRANAVWIAAANPAAVLALVDRLERVEAMLAHVDVDHWHCEGEAVGVLHEGVCSPKRPIHSSPCGPRCVVE